MRNNEYKKAFNQLNVSYKTIDNLYEKIEEKRVF